MTLITPPTPGEAMAPVPPSRSPRPTLTSVGLLERSPIPSVVLVPDGWVIWHNDAATDVLGGPDGRALLGRTLPAIVDVDGGLVSRWITADLPHRVVAHLHGPGDTPCVELHAGRLENGSLLVQFLRPAEPSGPDAGDMFRAALLELSEWSHDGVDDAQFFRTLLRRAIAVIPGAQAGSILLRTDPANRRAVDGADTFDFVAAEGFDLRALQRFPIAYDELPRDAVRPTATISYEIDNSELDPDKRAWLVDVGRTDEIRTSLSAPVILGGDAVAFFNLDNFEDRDAFDESSIEMATLLGRLIADLIRRRRLEAALRSERESYRHLAHHDPLTGLANRRHIEMLVADAAAESRGRVRPMAFLYLDLDDFKSINDTLGHDVGDQVLVAVAERLRSVTRRHDVLGRWGGDEFVLLALECDDAEGARVLGERLVAAMAAPLRLTDGTDVDCGVSVGVAWSPTGSRDAQALLNDADQALYDAKLAGKGIVRLRAA